MPRDDFKKRCRSLGVNPADFEESFCRSSGPGGQNVNKVSTAVEFRHRPSGLAVSVQDSRFQAQNRRLARERLLDLIESRRQERTQMRLAAQAKARRQRARRSAGTKRELVAGKRVRSAIKQNRRRPSED
ncbi:MAG: peptide chain release factor-like protein [Methylacidiphilales bacterium]|nr:peptide chain release factor-like protein [Candidatus Methylacidiphilales bacterium]